MRDCRRSLVVVCDGREYGSPVIAVVPCGFSILFLVRDSLLLDILDIQDPPQSVVEIQNCWVGILSQGSANTFAAVARIRSAPIRLDKRPIVLLSQNKASDPGRYPQKPFQPGRCGARGNHALQRRPILGETRHRPRTATD
jgi:hypothetical protein